MRTPGRCTNLEGCWISASHRSVWLSIGEDFVCPNCGGNLAAPLPQTRSFRAVKRAAMFGVAASLGVAVIGLGAVKLSTLSWPGRSIAVAVVDAPATLFHAVSPGKPGPLLKLAAEAPAHVQTLTTSTELMARNVVAAGPNSPFAMQGISAFNANARAHAATPAARMARNVAVVAPRATGPLMLYTAPLAATFAIRTTEVAPAASEQRSGSTISQTHGAIITALSEAPLSSGQSPQRPVILPITFGQPTGPETDVEPVSMRWQHHGVTRTRHSGFLPAVATQLAPAGADAIAQICRIPSLMH